jgi:hypothetical protein
MGQIAWDVTSVLPIFVLHHSRAILRVIRLTDFVTQLIALSHAGSLVSCHNFHSLRLCFNSRSRPGRSLFMSESVTLLVASLYAEATEAVKSRATLSASTPELISILGYINSEARLWNRSQFVNFSIDSERFLTLTWSSISNIIGRWSESKISETLWYFGGPQYLTRHHFPEGNEWGIVVLKLRIRSSRIRPLVSRLKSFELHYSKMGA